MEEEQESEPCESDKEIHSEESDDENTAPGTPYQSFHHMYQPSGTYYKSLHSNFSKLMDHIDIEEDLDNETELKNQKDDRDIVEHGLDNDEEEIVSRRNTVDQTSLLDNYNTEDDTLPAHILDIGTNLSSSEVVHSLANQPPGYSNHHVVGSEVEEESSLEHVVAVHNNKSFQLEKNMQNRDRHWESVEGLASIEDIQLEDKNNKEKRGNRKDQLFRYSKEGIYIC